MQIDTESKLIISFYGPGLIEPFGHKVKSWWEWCDQIIASFNISLTHVDVSLKVAPKRLKDNTPYNIDKYKKRIEQQISMNNVYIIGLSSMSSYPKGYIAFDWDFTSTFGYDTHYGSLALVGIDINIFKEWNKQYLLSFLNECLLEAQKRMKIWYGFASILPKKAFPSGYAIGIMSTGVDEKLIYDATAWRRNARKHCKTNIRNIYGWNILNKDHVNNKIYSCTLKEWIRAKQERGKIYAINNGLICWTFESLSEDIAFLEWEFPPVKMSRNTLEKCDIFPWLKLEKD